MRLDEEAAAILPKDEWLEPTTCKHVCLDEISLPCVVKWFALVWFDARKNDVKRSDNNVFVVSSNNECQVSSKNAKVLGSFAYKSSFKKI